MFLWRFDQLTRARRGNVEMVKWIGQISLLLKRLKDSWMDMLPTLGEEQRQNQYLADVVQENAERQTRSETALDPNAPATREKVECCESLFSFRSQLTTLMFIVSSDLSEPQRERERERLTSSLFLRRTDIPAYTFESVRTVFVELFCTPTRSMKTRHSA